MSQCRRGIEVAKVIRRQIWENTADLLFLLLMDRQTVPWHQVKEYMHVESPLEKLGRRANGENDTPKGACRVEYGAGLLVMVLVQL